MLKVVIIHWGPFKDYVESGLKITSKNNKVYFIGHHDYQLPNVEYVEIDKYFNNQSLKHYYTYFINYSSNSKDFEWFCFARVFILSLFLDEYALDSIFHLDSDCILLKNINSYPFEKKIAYQMNKNWHEYRMSHSIHNALLNKEFCHQFERLYNEIYVTMEKMNLLKGKIEYHKTNQGGVCDMTLYYLLNELKYIDCQDLSQIVNGFTFNNNINGSEGPDSKNQFKKNYLVKKEGSYYLYDTISDKNIELFSIHFQGPAKMSLAKFK